MRARPWMSGTFSTLARRWKMALREMAPILLRPHRARLVVVAALTLLAAAGCAATVVHRCVRFTRHPSHRLGPVHQLRLGFRFGSRHHRTRAPRGAGSSSRTLSSEPAIDEPAGASESTVPSLGSPAGSPRSSQRNVLPEPAPKASIGGEPDLDMLPVAIGEAAELDAVRHRPRPRARGRHSRARARSTSALDTDRRRPHGVGHGPGPPGQHSGAAPPLPG